MVCPSPDGGLLDVEPSSLSSKQQPELSQPISGKPNPGMILHKIEALGLKPEEWLWLVIDSTQILPWRIVPIVWVSWSFQERLRKRMLLPRPKVEQHPRSLFHPLMRYLGDELGLKQRWQLCGNGVLSSPDEIHQAGENAELRLEKLCRAKLENKPMVRLSIRTDSDPDGGRRESI